MGAWGQIRAKGRFNEKKAGCGGDTSKSDEYKIQVN